MRENRLSDYLEHMRQAAEDAVGFVEGMNRADFLNDKRTQQAVVMSLIVLGEAATKVMDRYPDFADTHPQIPWRNMRGMRNPSRTAISIWIRTWFGTLCRRLCRRYALHCRGW